MVTKIEPLYKSNNLIQFGWNPEPVSGIARYNVYVGQVADPTTMILLDMNVSPVKSLQSVYMGKVAYDATIENVRDVLSLPTTIDFSNIILYFTITYVDSDGVESSIFDSIVVEVLPVGIMQKLRKEDPTADRHIFGFTDELQRWIKISASSSGAIITDSASYWATNTITEYVYDSSNQVVLEKSYLADRTTAGSPAKTKEYEYDISGNIIKLTVSDSTV